MSGTCTVVGFLKKVKTHYDEIGLMSAGSALLSVIAAIPPIFAAINFLFFFNYTPYGLSHS